jgi:hypothetical protein
MEKTLILSFITLLLSLTAFSQVDYSIKGVVKTDKGYLPAGNVLALNPQDSTFVKGTSFLEGAFELNDIKLNQVLLKFTSLEFEDLYVNVRYENKPEIDLGEIIVSDIGLSLDEVTIYAKRPTYTYKTDGTLEVNIENTVLSSSNSVNEILSKSPDIVTADGVIEVLGKGEAVIYLNGKRITNDQLSLISPSNVKKLEIIRNPSSKYDAEGAAVINITTIKQRDNGYQASIRQNVSYSEFGGTNTYSSLNLNYKYDNFSLNAYYSLQLGEERELLFTSRDRDAENVFLTTDLTTDWRRKFDNYSYYGLGMQYDFNDDSYLSLEYSGFIEKLGGNTSSNNTIVEDIGESFFRSKINVDEDDMNNSISLNYNKSIDSLGSSLFIGGQYSKFDLEADNFIDEESFEPSGDSSRILENIQNLEIDVASGQLDYTKVFKNENILEMGVKYSYINNDFVLDFLVSDDGVNFILDEDFSNTFTYKEAIGAAYASYRGNLNKSVSYSVGLRAEHTDYELKLSQLNNEPIEDKFLNLFPNVSISKTFANNQTVNLSYSSRINRAPYQTLNPVLIYQDPYTSVQGNPRLIPQRTHSLELNTKVKKISYKLGYNYVINPFGQTALRGDDTKSYILQRINYNEQHEFFASASRAFRTDWWTSRNTFSLKYTNINEKGLGFVRVEPRLNPYFYSNNQFIISDTFNAELLFWYLGDNYEGLHRRERIWNLTASVEKTLFDKSLSVRFIANDIFHSFIAQGGYNVAQTEVYYNRRWSTDYFRLSVTYNFGKLKKSKYRNKGVGRSENNRAQ